MPNRVPWSPSYNVGHPLVDSQHQALLAHCHALADLFEAGAYASEGARFDERFQRLMELAREHFASESSLLERHAYRALDELQDEYDEFEFLADKILHNGPIQAITCLIEHRQKDMMLGAAITNAAIVFI